MKNAVASQPFEFRWNFPKEGFEFERAMRLDDGTRDVYLIEKYGPPPFIRREYTPFRFEAFSGLFREFAAVPPTREGVLAFAGKYGQLGKPLSVSVFPDKYAKAGRGPHLPFFQGETLLVWKWEITAMRTLVEAWDAIRAGDAETLGKWLQWKDAPEGWKEGKGVFVSPPKQTPFLHGWLALPGDDMMGRLKPQNDPPRPGDLLGFGRYWLQRELNNMLERHPSTPHLLWLSPGDGLRLFIQPASLISALWLQFSYAVAGNWVYRSCLECGRWFQVGPGADLRMDAKFCSNACKQRDWRNRQKKKVEK